MIERLEIVKAEAKETAWTNKSRSGKSEKGQDNESLGKKAQNIKPECSSCLWIKRAHN